MIPRTMSAVHLTGYGGFDRLEYRTDVAVPRPESGEVLVRVTAAGMNNTDINTRTGWYSPAVDSGTTSSGGAGGFGVQTGGMGGWAGDIAFPRIQGADCVGRIAAVGRGVDPARLGERVICDPYIVDEDDPDRLQSAAFLGSERDGAFAGFTCVPARNAVRIADDLPYSDAALATLPCSAGTAMNMLLMAGLKASDTVLVTGASGLVTGASGGVSTFLVQIARHRGAEVVAVCATAKADAVRALGAVDIIDRSQPDLVTAAKGRMFTLVADVVGGGHFGDCLALLGRGGRYVTAGAIAGPLVQLDLRTLYLRNLSLFGSTVYGPETFPELLRILLEGGLAPAVAATWPLCDIVEAQRAFLEKRHVGSMVLIPPEAAAGQASRPDPSWEDSP